MEKWALVDNKDYSVEASTLGRVRNAITKRVIKPYCNSAGYMTCHIYSRSRKKHINLKVHRLVASAFLPNVAGCKVVDHINGVRSDNRVINLRWVDKSTNNSNSVKRYRQPAIVCAEGLSEFFQEFETTSEAIKYLNNNFKNAVTPVITKDGLWACKTYE